MSKYTYMELRKMYIEKKVSYALTRRRNKIFKDLGESKCKNDSHKNFTRCYVLRPCLVVPNREVRDCI